MKAISRVTVAASTGLLMLAAGLVAPAIAHAESVRGVECTIVGTEGDDVLRGTADDDVICGLDGDDVLIGLGGDDVLVGGKGEDDLQGGRGDDTLIGGADKDKLDGGPGPDRLMAGAPTDHSRTVDILPVFQLPKGSLVEWMLLPDYTGVCVKRVAESWQYRVGDPVDFHFLLEGSPDADCLGTTTEYKWRVRTTTPDRETWIAQVALSVKFASRSSVVPEGTTNCTYTSEGLSCAGATTTQKFTPLLPLIVTVTIGPTKA